MAHLSHAGIDVASDRLDVMLLPDGQCFWVANNPAGWAELVARLRGLCIAAIGIEASGGTSGVSFAPCSQRHFCATDQ